MWPSDTQCKMYDDKATTSYYMDDYVHVHVLLAILEINSAFGTGYTSIQKN